MGGKDLGGLSFGENTETLRAFSSGVSNAKYLAFDTPNTKKLLS